MTTERLSLVRTADPAPAPGSPAPFGYFSRELAAEFIRTPGRRRFIRLARPLEYVRGNGVRHIIVEGFETDGGSIPRAVWWLIGHPLDGDHVRACVVHDWLCHLARLGAELEAEPDAWQPATRAHADSVFLEALRCEGLCEWRARIMYAGVRVGALWKR